MSEAFDPGLALFAGLNAIPKRAFLAQDAEARVFCHANAAVRRSEQNDEILRFAEFWRRSRCATTTAPSASGGGAFLNPVRRDIASPKQSLAVKQESDPR